MTTSILLTFKVHRWKCKVCNTAASFTYVELQRV